MRHGRRAPTRDAILIAITSVIGAAAVAIAAIAVLQLHLV